MNCPVCTLPLQVTERQGVEIDYCPQCRGVWLDRGELDKIIERSDNNQANYPANAPTTMPRTPNYPQSNPQQGWNYKRDDDDDDDYRHGRKKKRGFLGELFDFD